MKPDTVHSLVMARALHSEAKLLIESSDRHMCSAGLILLQDALEIVFLALLAEKGIDEKKSLENKSFDELIGELKKAGVSIPKTGTLKALNKQRVIVKHYGQLAEAATVHTCAVAANLAIDSTVEQVTGKNPREIFLSDLLHISEAKQYLQGAAEFIEQGKYEEAITEIRKAIFVEIEVEYVIHGWRDVSKAEPLSPFAAASRGGLKAPYHTQNMEWIEKYVHDPTDYVQVDHARLRLDAMEWDVNTSQLGKLLRSTPEVFRFTAGEWYVKFPLEVEPGLVTKENAVYCLETAISIIGSKQRHKGYYPWRHRVGLGPMTPLPEFVGKTVYAKADRQSESVHTIQPDWEYMVRFQVTGFNPDEEFFLLLGHGRDDDPYVNGYLLIEKSDPVVSGGQDGEEGG